MALVPTSPPITLQSEPLLDVASALHGTLFLCLSADALATWDAETLTICHVNRRSAASIAAHGLNIQLFLQDDARLAIVRTQRGSLLTYALHQDLEKGALKLRDTAGVVQSWTKHKQTIKVAAEAQAMCATADYLLFSTRQPATYQILPWQASKKGKAQTVCVEWDSLPFLEADAGMLVEIQDCAKLQAQVWRTEKGHVYLVQASLDEGVALNGRRIGAECGIVTAVLLANETLFLASESGVVRAYALAKFDEVATLDPAGQFTTGIRSLLDAKDQMLVCTDQFTMAATKQGEIFSTLQRQSGKTVWISSQSFILHNTDDKLTVSRYARVVPGSGSARPMLVRPDKVTVVLTSGKSDEPYLQHINPPEIAVPNIECASVSVGGRYVAVSGGGRIAHCSTRSGSWQVQSAWDEPFMTTWLGWYLHMLIAAGTTPQGSFEIRLFSRESSLSHAVYVHQLDEPLECLCLQGDMLLAATKTELCCWRVAVQKSHQICLDPMWRAPFTHEGIVQSLSLVEGPPGAITAAFVLFGQKLMLIRFAPKVQETVLVEHVQRMQYHHEKGPLQGTLWAICAGHLQVWQSPLVNAQPFVHLALDLLPLTLCFKTGNVGGLCKSSTADGETFVEPGGRLQRQSFVPALICAYVLEAQSTPSAGLLSPSTRTASAYLQTLKTLPDFGAILERILYTTLEDDPDLLSHVWRVLAFFAESTAAVSRCARKVEAKRWPALFAAVGRPATFFKACLAEGALEVAGSFLIVMSTLPEVDFTDKDRQSKKGDGKALQDYKEASLLLLGKATAAQHWDLAAELLKFMTASLDSAVERDALRRDVLQAVGMSSSNERLAHEHGSRETGLA